MLEVWDEAKRLRCEWFNDYEKTASKPPMVIADLDVIQLDFRGKFYHFFIWKHSRMKFICRILNKILIFVKTKVTMSIAGWKYKAEKAHGLHRWVVSYQLVQRLHWSLLSMIIEVSRWPFISRLPLPHLFRRLIWLKYAYEWSAFDLSIKNVV